MKTIKSPNGPFIDMLALVIEQRERSALACALREAEMMREAAAEQRICRRCGAPLEEGYDVICLKCDYDDWHEEIPEIFPDGDGE